jgi:hypothetical protein
MASHAPSRFSTKSNQERASAGPYLGNNPRGDDADRQRDDPELPPGQGDHEKAKQADDQLPDQVDTERHGDLLERIGLDPDLLGRLGGGKIPGL